MKSLIIYTSIHHQNTEKIAKAIAKELKADLKKTEDVMPEDLEQYNIIGFGSGIYIWRHHKNLLMLANKLPFGNKKAFIFSTSGIKGTIWHKALKEKLAAKGYKIIGEFNCRGWDTFGPLKFVGGINKGCPNKNDLEKARLFAQKVSRLK